MGPERRNLRKLRGWARDPGNRTGNQASGFQALSWLLPATFPAASPALTTQPCMAQGPESLKRLWFKRLRMQGWPRGERHVCSSVLSFLQASGIIDGKSSPNLLSESLPADPYIGPVTV